MATTSPVLHVIDEDFVLPDRGDAQEGPRSAVPTGDPDEAIRLFHHYRKLRARILGPEKELPAPAGEEAITAAEEELGVPLPPDLRALYRIADGDGDLPNALFDRHPWTPVAEIVHEDDEWLAIAQEWESEPWRETVFDAHPPDTVRRSPMRRGWIRFADDTGGNWLAVDMDPAANGRPGQVIKVGVDHTEGPEYIADSVTAFLRLLVDSLERGDYRHDDGNLWIDADPPERSLTYTDDHPTRTRAGQAGPDIQKAQVTNADDCDFLAALPTVRSLTLSSTGSPDLTPLADRPIEYLNLTLESADLTAPAQNPELRVLSLTSTQPVDLTPLRTLPNLWALDITSTPVADLTSITNLKSLRVLEVTQTQWQQLSTLNLPPLALVVVHQQP